MSHLRYWQDAWNDDDHRPDRGPNPADVDCMVDRRGCLCSKHPPFPPAPVRECEFCLRVPCECSAQARESVERDDRRMQS